MADDVTPKKQNQISEQYRGTLNEDDAKESNELLRQKVIDALGAIVAVAGGVAVYAMQSDFGETGESLELQFMAVVTECVGALLYAAAGTVDAVFAVPRYLLRVLVIVEMLESLSGFGEPDIGAEFRAASATFSNNLSYLLESPASSAGWVGLASDRYARKIIDGQREPAEKIALADRKIVDTLVKQAYWVRQTREVLAAIAIAAGAAIPVAIVWANIINAAPGSQVVALRKLDRFGLICACMATVGTLAIILTLIGEATVNAGGFQDATHTYRDAVGEVDASIAAVVAGGSAVSR